MEEGRVGFRGLSIRSDIVGVFFRMLIDGW